MIKDGQADWTNSLEKDTKKLKFDLQKHEEAVKTRKRNRVQIESEESSLMMESDFEKDLDDIEGDMIIQEKITKAFVNQFVIVEITQDFEEFSQKNESLSQVIETQNPESNISRKKSKVLICHSAQYKVPYNYFVVVSGIISEFHYEVGDKVTTFGFFDAKTNSLVIRKLQVKPESFFDIKMILVSPSMKVKVTSLTAKSSCMRANILRSLHSPPGDFSVPGLKGTIQHAIFEKVMLSKVAFDEKKIKETVFEQMKEEIEMIFALGIDYDEFEKELIESANNVLKWKGKYLGTEEPLHRLEDTRIYLTELVITEKAFSSDVFGMSGIVDAIFNCRVDKYGPNNQILSSSIVTIPFELKTGKKVKDEYESQVLIYNFLMREDTGDFDIGFSFIYYSNVENKIDFVKLDHLRFYNLMDHRNHIISRTRKAKMSFENIFQYTLPARTTEIFDCNYCESKAACVTASVFKGCYSDSEKLGAFVAVDPGLLKSKTSARDTFSILMPEEEEMNFKKKLVTNFSQDINLDELDEMLNECENIYLQDKKKEGSLDTVKIPDIESLFTPTEPKFNGFQEVYNLLDLPRINYFVRWMDMILVEESFNLKQDPEVRKRENDQCTTSLDFESYDELKIFLKDSKASDRDLLLKFSHFFVSESDASLFLEKLYRGQSISLKHESMNIVLYGLVKSKSIRRKEIFAHEFFVMNLVIQCKQSHINNSFKNSATKINYDKITVGWNYYDPVYVFENKMRTNVVRLMTEVPLQPLSRVIIENQPPTYSKDFEMSQINSFIQDFDLNPNQKRAIVQSIVTENFNLILGKLL